MSFRRRNSNHSLYCVGYMSDTSSNSSSDHSDCISQYSDYNGLSGSVSLISSLGAPVSSTVPEVVGPHCPNLLSILQKQTDLLSLYVSYLQQRLYTESKGIPWYPNLVQPPPPAVDKSASVYEGSNEPSVVIQPPPILGLDNIFGDDVVLVSDDIWLDESGLNAKPLLLDQSNATTVEKFHTPRNQEDNHDIDLEDVVFNEDPPDHVGGDHEIQFLSEELKKEILGLN